MWFAIAVVVVISLVVYGWALVAIGDDDDDVSLAEYEAQRAEFESWFE